MLYVYSYYPSEQLTIFEIKHLKKTLKFYCFLILFWYFWNLVNNKIFPLVNAAQGTLYFYFLFYGAMSTPYMIMQGYRRARPTNQVVTLGQVIGLCISLIKYVFNYRLYPWVDLLSRCGINITQV